MSTFPDNEPNLLQIMNLFFFYLVTWRHLVAGACLGFLGYTFGASAALLARMSRPQVGITGIFDTFEQII